MGDFVRKKNTWEKIGRWVTITVLVSLGTTAAFYAADVLGFTETVAEWYLQWLLAVTTGLAYYVLFKFLEKAGKKKGVRK